MSEMQHDFAMCFIDAFIEWQKFILKQQRLRRAELSWKYPNPNRQKIVYEDWPLPQPLANKSGT